MVNPPDDEPKSERFNMFISKSEMEAIDDWSWRKRIRSKSEAVRRLVQIGLAVEKNLIESSALLVSANNSLDSVVTRVDNEIMRSKGDINELNILELLLAHLESFENLLSTNRRLAGIQHDMLVEIERLSMNDDVLTALQSAKEFRDQANARWKNWRGSSEYKKLLSSASRKSRSAKGPAGDSAREKGGK